MSTTEDIWKSCYALALKSSNDMSLSLHEQRFWARQLEYYRQRLEDCKVQQVIAKLRSGVVDDRDG